MTESIEMDCGNRKAKEVVNTAAKKHIGKRNNQTQPMTRLTNETLG